MIPHSFPYPTRKRSRAPSSLAVTHQSNNGDQANTQSTAPQNGLLSRYPTQLIKLCMTGHSDLIDLSHFQQTCKQFRTEINSIIEDERKTSSESNNQANIGSSNRRSSPSASPSNDHSDARLSTSSPDPFDVSDVYLPTPDAFLSAAINAEMINLQSYLDANTANEAAERATMEAQIAERRKQQRRERYLRDKKERKRGERTDQPNNEDADQGDDDDEKEEKVEPVPAIRRRPPAIKRGVFQGLDSVKLTAPVTHISHTLPIPESFGKTIPDLGALISVCTRKDTDPDADQIPISLVASNMSLNTVTNESFEYRVNKRVKQSIRTEDTDEEKAPELMDDDEILLRISVYASRSSSLLIEIVVLGSQLLSALTEMLDCCHSHDSSADTTSALSSSSRLSLQTSAAPSLGDPFLVIEGTRYSPEAMLSVRWDELTVRIGSHYHLCHKHHIHPVIITQVRCVHSGDADDRRVAAYPLLVHREPVRITLCGICRLLPSTKIVYNDYLCEDNPTWFCDPCYAGLHETVEGEVLYEPVGPVYSVD